MKKFQKTLPYDRAARVGAEIYKIIAPLCHEHLDEPRVHGVQITQVILTRDLRLARIYYFLSGDAAARAACQEGLESATGMLKRAINEDLALRYIPDLVFHFDESIEQGERVTELLRQLEPK